MAAPFHADKSFWLANAGAYQPSDPLVGEGSVDVAIIGGGFTGLSTAYHLRKKDAATSVALLEGECVAFGATGRTSGWVTPLGTIDLTSALQLYGEERVTLLQDYAWDGADMVRNMIASEQMESDFEVPGVTFTFHGGASAHLKGFYKFFSQHARAKYHVRWLDKEQVASTFNTRAFDAGVRFERSGQVNPVKHARELKRIAEGVGARIYEMTPVLDVVEQPSGFALQTPRGVLHCKKLVLATNGYTHLLPPSLRMERVELPMAIYQLMTEPLTEAQFKELGWERRQQFYDKSSFFPPTARYTVDGRLQFNWCHAHFISGRSTEEAQRVEHYDSAQHMFQKLWPVLGKVRIAQRWCGICSAAVDVKPQIGTLRGGRIAYAFGYSGAGIVMSHAFGVTLADLVLENGTEQTRQWWVSRDGKGKGATLRRFPPGSAPALRATAALYKHADLKRARKAGIY